MTILRQLTAGGAVVASIAACGRTDISDPFSQPDGVSNDSGFEAGVDGGPLDLCDPDGIRICGEGCPTLVTPDGNVGGDAAGVCPGKGCLETRDIHDNTAQAAGVCWADAQSIAKYLCGTCNDGEVCLQKSADELVCVPEDVCRALWTLGARDVCRYADFHRYDGRSLPPSSAACPLVAGTAGPQRVCSGSCPPCPGGERCVGRSPDHPFGVCRDDFVAGIISPQPSDFQSCTTCLSSLPVGADYVCAVFDTNAIDVAAAKDGGFCMPRGDCLKVGADLPGGLTCFDASGNRLGP